MIDLSVLVVEDNEMDMAVITEALKSANIEYIAVSNSHDAIEAAIKHKPRIALLDMHMPHIDGKELCEILQTNPLTSNIKIIFLTASASVDDILFGVNVHAAAYYIKGVPMRELLNRIISIDFATAMREEVNQYQRFNNSIADKYQRICELH